MTLTEQHLLVLADVARTLIPGEERYPSAAEAMTEEALIRVLDVRADLRTPLTRLLDELEAVPSDALGDTLRAMWASQPDDFEVLSTTVAGTYYLQPGVRRTIGYEGPVRLLSVSGSEATTAALETVAAPLRRQSPAG
jgi:hypothetical protein